jgi:hypothetical protein
VLDRETLALSYQQYTVNYQQLKSIFKNWPIFCPVRCFLENEFMI